VEWLLAGWRGVENNDRSLLEEAHMNNKSFPKEMSFEEMAEIVDQTREVNFYQAEEEQKAWKKLQLARAAMVLGLLRQHLPAEALLKVEDFLSTYYGSECLHHELTGQWFGF
jgi:hypothetical protein